MIDHARWESIPLTKFASTQQFISFHKTWWLLAIWSVLMYERKVYEFMVSMSNVARQRHCILNNKHTTNWTLVFYVGHGWEWGFKKICTLFTAEHGLQLSGFNLFSNRILWYLEHTTCQTRRSKQCVPTSHKSVYFVRHLQMIKMVQFPGAEIPSDKLTYLLKITILNR